MEWAPGGSAGATAKGVVGREAAFPFALCGEGPARDTADMQPLITLYSSYRGRITSLSALRGCASRVRLGLGAERSGAHLSAALAEKLRDERFKYLFELCFSSREVL